MANGVQMFANRRMINQDGGQGGTDTNTLSLNGRPIANVSRGESLNVGSKAFSGRQQAQQVTIVVQANDYFDAKVAGISQQVATPIAKACGSRRADCLQPIDA